MPNHRTPTEKANLTGAARNHPERFKDRKGPGLSGEAIGEAPDWLPEDAKAAWDTFAGELGWLVAEDRPLLEAVCMARATLRQAGMNNEPLPAAFFATYRSLLGSLGATPVDRTRLGVGGGGEDDNDPFEGFDGPTQ